MTRKRSALGEMQERAFWRDWDDLRAREEAELAKRPPMPDPAKDVNGYLIWIEKYGEPQTKPAKDWPTPAWKELQAERAQMTAAMRELPALKFRRQRDDEVWSWIGWLLACQGWGAPFDLMTCSLGANPANENARPSTTLRYLMATVTHRYPEVEADPRFGVRLYDAIRHWRRVRARIDVARSVSTI